MGFNSGFKGLTTYMKQGSSHTNTQAQRNHQAVPTLKFKGPQRRYPQHPADHGGVTRHGPSKRPEICTSRHGV